MEAAALIKSFFVIPIVFVGFGLSFWVLLSDKKSMTNRILFLEIIVIMLSILTDYCAALFNGLTALLLIRISYVLLIFAAAIFYYFVQYFPFKSKRSLFLDFLVSFATLLIGFVTIFSNRIVHSIDNMYGGNQVNLGGYIWLYYFLSSCLIIVSFLILFSKYNESTKINKSKMNLMIIGIMIYVLSQVTFNLILPMFGIQALYYLGDYSIIIFIVFTAYAIVKHHLFDLKLAVMRSVTYFMVLSTLAGLYFIAAYILSLLFNQELNNPGQAVGGVIVSLMLAFVFQPIKHFFDRITDRLFYKSSYNSDIFFAHINQIATLTTDLGELLRSSANEIAKTIKIEQVYFIVLRSDERPISAGTRHHNNLPVKDIQMVNNYFKNSRNLFLDRSYLSDDEKNNDIKRLLVSHKTELILPLIISKEFIGYMCLGDKKIGQYSSRDVNVLKTVSDELTIAIKNALAIQEVRDLNATLKQRIANATKELRSSNVQLQRLDKAKDEFVGMASHQLRTPLTTIKGYLSMVMEGDAGEISAEQYRLLDEAFMSSERMVNLINDFLNVSRIQTGKFIIDKHPTNLVKLIEQEVDRLRPNANSRGLEFIFKKPKDFPTVNIDESKMREVVMNFADNALYYSYEGAKIDVRLYINDKNQAVFEIIDTGIGVSADDQPRLFTKFYRASNAKRQRPDGTGVGLFLAKKVISAHGGKIIFESVEGKGSMFGFSLPIE